MNIVLGVTGGIAAYKAVSLARLFVQAGHDLHIVPTDDALRFVGLPTWEAISRNPVTTSVHDDVPKVRHVALGQQADLIVIAPATANTLAEMAAGLASNLLGTTLLASKAPVLVAPAMHTEMWQHPATQANVATLRSRGVHFVGPDSGELTGGDSGPGRLSEPEAMYAAALALIDRQQDLAGLTVAISAGGTREPIDPVRFIGNRSSGRQGVALAVAAAQRGATVKLAACNIEQAILAEAQHPGIEIHTASTALELADLMDKLAPEANIVVMAAAVADFRVAEIHQQKWTKETGGVPSLNLVANPDIVAGLSQRRREGQLIVGFAAETADDEELLRRGQYKQQRKGLDLLAVNQVGWDKGFEVAENTLQFIGREGVLLGKTSGTKRQCSDAMLDVVAQLLSHHTAG